MPWYFYLLQFAGGLFLFNGVPHFVQSISGHRFQSPFATPPGLGESAALINVPWGYAKLLVGAVLLWVFQPRGDGAVLGWILAGPGFLMMSVMLPTHFGKVRSRNP